MDTRSNKLADLKLVNKYYPGSGVANYSYPHSAKSSEQALSPTSTSAAEPAAAAAALAGRSSVGSEASVPGMVPDDRDSIISVDLPPLDGLERDSYHSSGAVLWDSFWEDPFWEAKVEEDAREAPVEGAFTQRLMGNSNGSYPALIPSPGEDGSNARKDGYFVRIDSCSKQAAVNGLIAGPESTEPDERQRSSEASPRRGFVSQSATPKANTASTYSPFPPSMYPTSINNASNANQTTSSASRNTMFCETTALDDSLIPAPLSLRKTPGRTAHLKTSDATTLALRSTWTHSTPVTAVVTGPLAPPPPVIDSSLWRDSAQSLGLAQRLPVPVSLCRTRSDTVVSTSSVASSSHRRSGLNQQQHEMASRPLPPIPPPIPPARRHRVRHSQPEVAVSPPCQRVELQRCMTEGQRPQVAQNQTLIHSSRPSSNIFSTMATSPAALVTTRQVPTPAVPDPPMPVSVFEDDSEDENDDGREERSFARRIARSLTTSKRTRSASATARSRKGYELAKVQLRRVRAGGGAQVENHSVTTTTTSVPVPQPPTESNGESLEKNRQDGEGKGADARVLRKQRSEMLGRIFWGWH